MTGFERLKTVFDFRTPPDPGRRAFLQRAAALPFALKAFEWGLLYSPMSKEPAILSVDPVGTKARYVSPEGKAEMVCPARVVIDPFNNPNLEDGQILLGMTNKGAPPRIAGFQYFIGVQEIAVPLGDRGAFTPIDMGNKYTRQHAEVLRAHSATTFIGTSALVLIEPPGGEARRAHLVTPLAERRFGVQTAFFRDVRSGVETCVDSGCDIRDGSECTISFAKK